MIDKGSKTSGQEDFLQSGTEEGKVVDCAEAAKTLAHDRPFAVLGSFFVPEKNLSDSLTVLHC